MLNRTNQNRVEAAVEKNFDTKQYTWHKYTSDRGTKLTGPRGAEVVLRKGDLYGVKEYNSKQDMYLVLKMPTTVFKVNIGPSDKLMNEKSVETKGKKPTLPKNPPAKIKIDMSPKPKKTIKEAAAAKKTAPKADKPKLTANQKKIVAVKMEIKRLRGLTQNATNLRKIEAQRAELKKLNAKEKAAVKMPKNDAHKVNTETKVKKGAAPASKPFDPLAVSKKLSAKKAQKIKIQVVNPIIDEDDEEIPTGHVRYGGKLIEPDELEFEDEDLSGLIDMPIDESWSADTPQTSESGARKSKRMILEEDEESEEE